MMPMLPAKQSAGPNSASWWVDKKEEFCFAAALEGDRNTVAEKDARTVPMASAIPFATPCCLSDSLGIINFVLPPKGRINCSFESCCRTHHGRYLATSSGGSFGSFGSFKVSVIGYVPMSRTMHTFMYVETITHTAGMERILYSYAAGQHLLCSRLAS